jgi:hypothetical protein
MPDLRQTKSQRQRLICFVPVKSVTTEEAFTAFAAERRPTLIAKNALSSVRFCDENSCGNYQAGKRAANSQSGI